MKSRSVIFLGVLILAGGVIFAWQWQTGVRLREEAARLEAQAREAARLREENERLAAHQKSPAEMESLRADHAEMERLRGEIDALSRRVEQADHDAAQPQSTAVTKDAAPAKEAIAASAWKNAGQATPEAVLETALWSAKEGEIATLAGTLLLDERARTKAQALLASLPDAARAQYGTPEQLVAFLTAKDLPLTSLRVDGMSVNGDEAQMVVNVPTAANLDKLTELELHRSTDGWQIKVPESAIDKYARTLTGAPTPAAGTGL
jgi:hypothetical protein